MSGTSRGNAVKVLLSECRNPETGCFRDNPEALLTMLYFDDAGIRANLSSIAQAADEAAVKGQALDETTYTPIKIGIRDGAHALVDGSPEQIPHEQPNTATGTVSDIYPEVALCAYACGNAVEICPLKKPTHGR